MDVIEVYPNRSGAWRWRHRVDGKASKPSEAFDSRREAFEDALLERKTESIVLLRQDGSVHGELYHESRSGGPPQRVDLLAASGRDEGVSVGG